MKNARVLMFCAVAALCACHKDSGTPVTARPAPQIRAPAVVKQGPTIEEQTAGMVEAATQGKSTVQAELKFELPQKPQIGKALQINLAVLPQIDAGPVEIQVTSADGLALAAGTNQIEIPSVTAGHVYRQNIKVTPTADGVLLLGLTISLKHDEISESRVFSIPLIVDR